LLESNGPRNAIAGAGGLPCDALPGRREAEAAIVTAIVAESTSSQSNRIESGCGNIWRSEALKVTQTCICPSVFGMSSIGGNESLPRHSERMMVSRRSTIRRDICLAVSCGGGVSSPDCARASKARLFTRSLALADDRCVPDDGSKLFHDTRVRRASGALTRQFCAKRTRSGDTSSAHISGWMLSTALSSKAGGSENSLKRGRRIMRSYRTPPNW
jgi:hypothetical protein